MSASASASASVSEAFGCLQDKLLSMAVANHVLWPLAKFVNAKLVPKQHQPVANKVVQVSHAASLIIITTINSLSSAGQLLSLQSSSKCSTLQRGLGNLYSLVLTTLN